MFRFERLEVWKKSIELTKLIFRIFKSLPPEYKYTIGANLLRAALSIPNNIAEGSGRKSVKESANFYNISKGSTYEVVNVIIILKEEGILSESIANEIYDRCEELSKMLSGLIKFDA